MLGIIWFLLWGVLWAVYFMLDGFDLGLGTVMPAVAKNEEERAGIPGHGAFLGRQRSLADHGRRE